MPPKIFKNMDFPIFGGTFTAPTGGTVGVPRYHSLRLYMRDDKKIETKKFPKTFIFFDEKYFSKDFEKPKISKSHFFEEKHENRKMMIFRGKR